MGIFQKMLAKKEGKLKKNLFKAGLEIEGNFHQMVATDTGDLDRSIKTDAVKHEGGRKYSVLIGSDGVGYAKYVEKSSSVKNYHRGKKRKGRDTRSVIYRGKGMNLSKRVLEKSKEKVSEILKQVWN